MRKLKITEMGRLNIEEFHDSNKIPLVVVLDCVRSLYNVGSIFRTSDAFRLRGLCLCEITACPPHPEIHKTALAVSRSLEGTQLISSLLKLGFFLLLWFVVGIYVVPLFLRRFSKYINSETLLIVSVGLCFLLVFIAVKVGYSSAFGAFMMGSILSETIEAERIEQNVSSLKDLFGAIFFVSVGMLVDPSILAQYWLSILVITCAVIFGQMIFGTFSFVVSGHTLKESMQSGFSLAQIGEFAFIIAALGQRLEVTSNFLYPVVVAVSIITTFFTPYMIRAAEPTYKYFENKIFFKNIEKIQLRTIWKIKFRMKLKLKEKNV